MTIVIGSALIGPAGSHGLCDAGTAGPRLHTGVTRQVGRRRGLPFHRIAVIGIAPFLAPAVVAPSLASPAAAGARSN